MTALWGLMEIFKSEKSKTSPRYQVPITLLDRHDRWCRASKFSADTMSHQVCLDRHWVGWGEIYHKNFVTDSVCGLIQDRFASRSSG